MYPRWMFCQVRCIILKNTKSQHLSLFSLCCLPLCLCFPSSLSLCGSVCLSLSLYHSFSLSLSLRGVRGRECSGERGWVGMLDLLHLPFGRLEPTPSNSKHQGRGRENRWTEHQDRREKLSTKNSF